MPIRISHKICGGLAGFWISEPGMWDTEKSPNYRSPALLPIKPGDEIFCNKCNCSLSFHDMDWPRSVVRQRTVYEQVMDQVREERG